jgi:hypothetical protein
MHSPACLGCATDCDLVRTVAALVMRLDVVSLLLGLLLMSLARPAFAHASDAQAWPVASGHAPRLVGGSLALEASLLPDLSAADLSLRPPCLACGARPQVASSARAQVRIAVRLGQRASPTEPIVAPSARAQGRAPTRVTAPPSSAARRPIAIGESWRWSRGREFSIHLTPTPRECAPLVRLKF